MRARKGQAAMEFLTTYGWAFIIILTTIGALAYFGVLKWPVSSRCTISSEFSCLDYQIDKSSADEAVSIILVNGMENNIDVPSALCTYADNNIGNVYHLETLLTPGFNASTNWEPGEKRKLTCKRGTTTSLVSGEKSKVRFTITYYATDMGGFNHTVEGEVVAEVQG